MTAPAPKPAKPKPRPAERPKWVPPVFFAIAAFGIAFFGDMLDTVQTVRGWFVDPPLPVIAEEYLMIDLGYDEDLRTNFQGIEEQVQGLRVMLPAWLDTIDADADRMLTAFCDHNEYTMAGAFNTPEAPERLSLIADCRATASLQIIFGTYALKSFDSKPLTGLRIEVAVLTNDMGYVDAYDGFIGGALSRDHTCFESSISMECMASWTSTEVFDEIPTLGPGEMVVLPIFVTYNFQWSQYEDGSTQPVFQSFDGLAATPFRFPATVYLGDRVLIAAPRPMNETPSLRQGFYEGRG